VAPNHPRDHGLERRKNRDGKTKNSRSNRPSGGPSRDAPAPKPGLDARLAATKILGAVIDKKTPLDGMLDAEHGNPAIRELPEADRALVRAMLHSALRHLPRIEAILDSLLDTPFRTGRVR